MTLVLKGPRQIHFGAPVTALLGVLLLATLMAVSGPSRASDNTRVVYHLNEGVQQASRAIGNIRNHLGADPQAKIVVVAHGPGIDFLLDGAENMSGQKFASAIGELASRGVEFKVCNNTLTTRKISADRVVMEAKIVPSGVAEVATLQAKEKFVYLRP